MYVMNIKISGIFSLALAAAVIAAMAGCKQDGGSAEAEATTFDKSGYESRIAELEEQVESLRAETVKRVSFGDKSDFLMGKDNPAVSEAAAAKEDAMQDQPKTITIQGKEYSTALTSLTLNNMGLNDEDIKDLKYMVNLTELHIYQNNITDISPIKGLTDLKTLSLFKNNITDISPLAGLISLGDLYLPAGRSLQSDGA